MKLGTIYFWNMVILLLFGWNMVIFYQVQHEVAGFMNGNDGFTVTINLIPMILLIIIGIPYSTIITKRHHRNGQGWFAAIFLPPEFKEQDEREQALTKTACRNAYISMMMMAPLISACMVFYPFIEQHVIAFPIILVMLLPIIQITVFYLTLHRKLH